MAGLAPEGSQFDYKQHDKKMQELLFTFGLLIFLGYVVYDTQEIIERAHHSDMDYIKHALTLFTDFVAVLVRILVIMLKNATDKSEDKKSKKRC